MVNSEEPTLGEAAESRTACQNLKEVFGNADDNLDIWWLFPTELKKTLIMEREFD